MDPIEEILQTVRQIRQSQVEARQTQIEAVMRFRRFVRVGGVMLALITAGYAIWCWFVLTHVK